MYGRFPLFLRSFEELLVECGIGASDQTARCL